MFAVFNITFPIFALIALGYGLTRRGLFAPTEMQTLGRFTVNVALPALIFNAMVSRPMSEVVNPGYLLAYGGATVTTMALVFVILWGTGFRPTRRGIGVLGVCCSNSGYMGYPILMLAYPKIAATVLTLQVIIENFLSIPLALLVVESTTPRVRVSPFRLIATIFTGVLKRPMIQMVILGMAVNLAGIPIPGAVQHLVQILAAATAAIALFYIGGSLVKLPRQSGDMPFVSVLVTVKLIAMPLIAVTMIHLLPALGLPAVAPELAVPLVISAAMPMMGIFPILAYDYGEHGVASITLLAATTMSFFTISALLMVVHMPGM